MTSKTESAAIILLIFCMAGKNCAQANQDCSDAVAKVNELKLAIEKMYTPSATPPPTIEIFFYTPFNWTSVAITFIGSSDLELASNLSFAIPSVIPSNATEVLIYAAVYSGNTNNEPLHHIKVFTQIGSNRYEKYLALYPFPQIGINTNSDNMWFPMPPNRMVYLTVPYGLSLDAGAQLYAIGYR